MINKVNIIISFTLAAAFTLIAVLTEYTENYIDRVSQSMIETKIEFSNYSIGQASYYDYELNGIIWSINHLTAASRDLPRYNYAKITNLENNKSVVVFINDYGPADIKENKGRVVDLSSAAFKELAPLKDGLIQRVKVELLN